MTFLFLLCHDQNQHKKQSLMQEQNSQTENIHPFYEQQHSVATVEK